MRNKFSLPTLTRDEFNIWRNQASLISNYLNISSIAVVLICIKNLRIMTLYFPAFGLLFDTLIKAKDNLILFMIIYIVFIMAFMFTGNNLFGNHAVMFSTVGNSGVSLYRMLFGDFFIADITKANKHFAMPFFFLYVLGGFFVMINVLIAILATTYDALRNK